MLLVSCINSRLRLCHAINNQMLAGSGTLSLRKGGAQMFELNLSDVAKCMAPGNKADELDVTFVDSAG